MSDLGERNSGGSFVRLTVMPRDSSGTDMSSTSTEDRTTIVLPCGAVIRFAAISDLLAVTELLLQTEARS